MRKIVFVSLTILACASAMQAAEFHVATSGSDSNPGTQTEPFHTIQHAADIAKPGDVITVHAGTYRERVNPPRGGESDTQRIVYQAAPGEKVVIKGSEVVTNWVKVQGDVWKTTLPNSYFGAFNPFSDLIHGDWFNPKHRQHHTGAVYLNGDWLIEAAQMNDVYQPVGKTPLWFAKVEGDSRGFLMNVASLRPGNSTSHISAVSFADKRGTQLAPCSEGGQCIGSIKNGDWLRYKDVDFGSGTESVEIRAASVAGGGEIELRLDKPDGDLLGTCPVSDTGDWQKWASFTAKIKPVSGVRSLCLVFKSGHSESANTTIWAQFKDVNPNEQLVEINARQTVFYPSKTGINYLTIRGFTMCDAATPWAPPTAGQIGLIGTNWSKGWIIENNTISYSICSGIALGKYSDQWDNKLASAEAYVKTIHRALAHGWNKATVGSHIVRNNEISHCEQTGIVGSLGCSFSTITGNSIHDIHVRQVFTGAEVSGIKFHGAIDVEISHNHIYRTVRGIWLDWMAQGTHVTGNLFHDNLTQDVFFEVDHGPFLVDNNIFLSPKTLLTVSQGGAFVHNLIAGDLQVVPFDKRMTPFMKAHSTQLAGLHNNPGGDVRFYNNLFVESGEDSSYNKTTLPVWMNGNVFLKGAQQSTHETNPLLKPEFDPAIHLVEEDGAFYLEMKCDSSWSAEQPRQLVTTDMLGMALIPNVPFEHADGTPYRLNTDYFGKKRDETNPTPGPFENPSQGALKLKVW